MTDITPDKIRKIHAYNTCILGLAINRTPHYDVWSARPRAVNIGDVRIPHLHPQHQKCVVLDTLFSA